MVLKNSVPGVGHVVDADRGHAQPAEQRTQRGRRALAHLRLKFRLSRARVVRAVRKDHDQVAQRALAAVGQEGIEGGLVLRLVPTGGKCRVSSGR